MYITNSPEVAKIAENTGVDRIFIDMEYIGKNLRQGGMDTVQSHHTIEDIKCVRNVISKAELLVRCNPIHEESKEYVSSEEEINNIIQAGADIIMLPYFKTAEEVQTFIKLVNGRTKTMLLVETPEAVKNIDDILQIPNIDEMYVGLNDLSLGYGKKFMFELLADGTVEKLGEKFKKKGIPYGFGGLATLEGGLLPGKMVLKEHYRMSSRSVILSRSFCNTSKIKNVNEINDIFTVGIAQIREYEMQCIQAMDFEENRVEIKNVVRGIVEKL